jgi:hypothetical protein
LKARAYWKYHVCAFQCKMGGFPALSILIYKRPLLTNQWPWGSYMPSQLSEGDLWKISFIQADLLQIEHRQVEALLNVQVAQTKQTLD